MSKVQQWAILAILATFSSLSFAGNQIIEYPIQHALNSEEAKLRLGDSVKFYFGEKPANVSGRVIVVSKVLRKTARDKDDPCDWALLSALLKLKEEAIKRGSKYVVNIASNYNNNLIVSKTNYQCAVGGLMVAVALKGELLEPSAAMVGGDSSAEPEIISNPVNMSDAVLTPEPIVSPHVASPHAGQESSSQPLPAPQKSDLGNSVEERLQVLKALYQAGEIDQKTYEAQKQRVLDGI